MNWYKQYSRWHEFGPTVTLFHGTNETNFRRILESGLKPVNVDDVIDSAIRRCGLERSEVPSWIWREEKAYRKGKPEIYLTTYKRQAEEYAKGAKYGGEIETSVINNIRRWLEKEGRPFHIQPDKPVVVTLELPWDRVKTYLGMDELEKVVERVGLYAKEHNEPVEESLSDVAYQFTANDEIGREFITGWEFV